MCEDLSNATHVVATAITKIHHTIHVRSGYRVNRYIQEESMEIEVWSCPTRRRPGEGEGEGEGAVPVSGDILLGTTTVSLQPLSSESSVRSDLAISSIDICVYVQYRFSDTTFCS